MLWLFRNILGRSEPCSRRRTVVFEAGCEIKTPADIQTALYLDLRLFAQMFCVFRCLDSDSQSKLPIERLRFREVAMAIGPATHAKNSLFLCPEKCLCVSKHQGRCTNNVQDTLRQQPQQELHWQFLEHKQTLARTVDACQGMAHGKA